MGMAAVLPLGTNETIAGTIRAPGEVDAFEVTLTDSGRLTVEVQTQPGCSLDTRLSLSGPDGELLIQSDGQSATNSDDRIVQHLLPGTYFVKVEGLGGATGDYSLTTDFHPANPPDERLLVNFLPDYPYAVAIPNHVAADFNGDGQVDIATANPYTNDVSVLLGLGDGTFQTARNFLITTGFFPSFVVTADFNRDGRLDLATSNSSSSNVSILMGQGDGSFVEAEAPFATGEFVTGLTTADLNEDDRLDLIAVNSRSNDVSILLGRGNGTFEEQKRYRVGDLPFLAAVADFTGDGHLDVAVGNFNSADISLLAGNGDGTLRDEVRLALGRSPNQIISADFNGDGRPDLATANAESDVSVLLGHGDGTFTLTDQRAAGLASNSLTTTDFNGDGHLDLAAANRDSNDASVFLGRGDGTFQDEVRYRTGNQAASILTEDFNGDQRPDLAVFNIRSHDVSILLGVGDGTFLPDRSGPPPGETNPQGALVDDFNRDGHLDLAVVTYTGGDVLVFFGRGDGTFQNRTRYEVGSTPVQLLSADFNEDGHTDLATTNCDSQSFTILLGRGDGTFEDQFDILLPLRNSGEFVVVGDFNRDGHADLAGASQFTNGASVLLGNGNGTFQAALPFAVDEAPGGGAAGDFNGDGRLDLALTNFFARDLGISVYLGQGDGTFPEEPDRYDVGAFPLGLVTADFNRDGHLDLANTNFDTPGSVSILLSNRDGTFRREERYETGGLPESLVATDLNGDSLLDLVVTSDSSNNVSVLLGNGDGTFRNQALFPVSTGASPRRGLGVGDFNGDGRLDLAIPQVTSNDVTILFGAGDGSFSAPLPFAVGLGPVAFVADDFSGDGRPDVASVNPTTDTVAVALGVGDATLQPPVFFAVGAAPAAVVQADFNGDGRPDLAAANFGSNDVSVLLGLGTGAFRGEVRFAAGVNPVSLVPGDFNRDGRLDLAVANAGSNDVSILLGRGDGTFQPQLRFTAPDLPQSLAAGDFNGDGRLDLATANYRSEDVAIFLSRGDGTFQAPVRMALGTAPIALLARDLDGEGLLDLATANYLSDDVSVLPGRGDGTFHDPVRYMVGSNPQSLTVGDFDRDGLLDLATANSASDDVSFLLGRGDGTFSPPLRRAVGDYPLALAAADFNGDGRLDLALAEQLSTDVSILQGLGDTTFVDGGTISNPLHATPLVADWDGDGLADVAVVSREGKILLRLARPGAVGVFEAPVLVNPEPGHAVRDLALLAIEGSFRLAALSASDSSLSFYTRGPDGTFVRTPGPAIPGTLPVDLATGDLNGDSRLDLIVAAAGSGEVLVYLQSAAGGFGPDPDFRRTVGVSPSALGLFDADGDGRLDIVVTNQFSGDVSVLLNAEPPGAHATGLATEGRFRAGTGVFSLDTSTGALVVRSQQGPAGLVAGPFDADAALDLIVTNSGANSFALLRGSGAGGFLNPEQAPAFLTGARPGPVVAGRFNADEHLDLAILNEASADLSVFLGDGRGGFTLPGDRLSAGNLPTGLSVHDVNGDGRLDLLVGNDFGDLLILPGNGDGTFQPYQRAGRSVALAVADLNGDGHDDFVFGNEARDRVTVQFSRPGQTFTQERDDGVLAPGAVTTADLNRDGWADLMVANGGGNNVLVYLGEGEGQFGPARRFFAGTNPVGVNAHDLNGDGRPDLVVANEGSNDVTVLLGEGEQDAWTLGPGPRLRGGLAPVSTTVQDVTGDGRPDLLVSNSQSDNVLLLPGVGGGFFNDQDPRQFNTGASPRQAFAGNFDALAGLDLVSVNAASSSLTFFSNFLAPSSAGFDIASGGLGPVAALAGDFNADGLSDLLVAHNGDGAVALLFGEQGGLGLRALQSLGDLAHPTALALARVTGGELDVYMTGEDAEAVQRLSFVLDFGPIALAQVDRGLPLGGGREQVADLLPLEDTTLAVVATLLSGRPGGEGLSERLERELLAAGREGAGPEDVAALLRDPDAAGPGGAGEEWGAGAEGGADPEAGPDSVARLVTGQEEAFAGRPPVTRESLLDPARGPVEPRQGPPLRELLDDWLPGAPEALDEFWQRLAADGRRLGDAAAAALHAATAPLRAELLLPGLRLQEALGVLSQDVRGLVDAALSAMAPATARPEVPGDVAPAEAPRREEDGPPPPPEGAPDEAALGAALVTALFASGYCWKQGHSHVEDHAERNRRGGRRAIDSRTS